MIDLLQRSSSTSSRRSSRRRRHARRSTRRSAELNPLTAPIELVKYGFLGTNDAVSTVPALVRGRARRPRHRRYVRSRAGSSAPPSPASEPCGDCVCMKTTSTSNQECSCRSRTSLVRSSLRCRTFRGGSRASFRRAGSQGKRCSSPMSPGTTRTTIDDDEVEFLGGQRTLDAISFEVRAGEGIGLLGPNQAPGRSCSRC